MNSIPMLSSAAPLRVGSTSAPGACVSEEAARPVDARNPDGERLVHLHLAIADDPFVFGDFRLLLAQRRLERDGEPLRLGDKAFEVLRALVENAGQVVRKSELLDLAGVAGEDSLRFHIAALRKTLGDGRYIANVAGQGYSFVAPISRRADSPAADVRPPSARPLPILPRRLVGRDDVLEALAEQLFDQRFVTVVGPGGVGKTAVALTLAHQLAARFDGDVCFFDVASVLNPDLLAGALGSALGVPIQPAGAAPGLVAFVQRRRMLLVLDGCEPGVEAAAALAEHLSREAPQMHILATSREALRADGEHVYRLFPLDCPVGAEGQTAGAALGFAAVQLFVERVASSQQDFMLTDEEAPIVSEICRKLDGLALAIEFAAGRVDAFGVREVARQLESQFALMWPGRRTAVARHQTLNATLGWSHQLLSEHERLVFRRLSIFAGSFTLDMATALVADVAMPQADTIEGLGSLVSKSLVQFNVGGAGGGYRLLDITRSYALDRLAEAGETRLMAERHASLLRRVLEDAAASPPNDGRLRELLDDVSAAIEWGLSPDGDLDSAAALAVGSAPLWLQAGVLMECRFWMARVLDSVPPAILGEERRLALEATLASAETFTDGFSDESYASWQSALATASLLGNIPQQLTCLVVLWAHRIRAPRYPDALALAEQMGALAAPLPDPGAHATADWMVGISHHHLGRLATARARLEQSLAGDTLEARQAMMSQFGYDRRIPTMGVLSNLHWLEGRPDAAARLGAVALTEARGSAYPVPVCEALTWQALNLHLRGDDPSQVAALADEAIVHARPHFIESYVGLGMALKGLNAAAQGDMDAASLVGQGLELLTRSRYEVFHPLFLTELARLRAEAGAPPGADEMGALLALDGRGPEQWGSAEVKRNLGEVLLHYGEARRAAELFADAAACAERQGAVGWGLRAALSLARSATDFGARRVTRERLAGVLGRLTGGAGTADRRAATEFLASERV